MRSNHPFCRPFACLLSALGSLFIPCCGAAFAQNLYNPPAAPAPAVQPAPPAPAPGDKAPPPAPAAQPPFQSSASDQLSGVSLFSVAPPPPPRYAKHDLIEVIINESSVQSFNQTLDTKKDYSLKAELSKFPSFNALLDELSLREGIGSVKPGLGVTHNNKFKGDAKSNRKDQITAKITATVVDVKPNGNLVLEARESITADREISTMVLAGTCRAEDITRNNTIQSSQIANLNIRIEHEGDVKDANTKGFIPRILEAVFNF